MEHAFLRQQNASAGAEHTTAPVTVETNLRYVLSGRSFVSRIRFFREFTSVSVAPSAQFATQTR